MIYFILSILVAFAEPLAVEQAAIAALSLDFGVDGRAATAEGVASAYAKACAKGAPVACRVDQFQTDGRVDRAKAQSWLRTPCGEGDPIACLALGWSLALKPDGEIDRGNTPPDARLHLDLACREGLLRGCVERGALLVAGAGGPADPTTAARLFARACENGEPVGCWRLGVLHQSGRGVKADYAEARRLFAESCDQGELLGCNAVALADHLGLDGNKDVGAAAVRYADACDRGLTTACHNLTKFYEQALGQAPVPAAHWDLLDRGCTRDIAAACSLLGRSHTDPVRVSAALERACGLKDGSACLDLALTSPPGAKQADKLLIGCGFGYGPACTLRGELFAKGVKGADAIDKDEEEAAASWADGCENGDPNGCYLYAEALRRGKGAIKDAEAAKALYRRACENGVQAACKQAK